MKNIPKYCENIIVGVKHRNNFNWYITDKEFWLMDLYKLIEAYESNGYEIPHKDDFLNRFDIPVLDERNVGKYLDEIDQFKVTTNNLKNILKVRIA